MEKERNNLGQFTNVYTVNEDFFEEINSEEKAYTLGFFYADGCNFISKTGQKVFKITQLEQDKDILDKISKSMNSTYKYQVETQLNKKVKYSLYITSNKLCNDLNKLGAEQRKSLNIKFPTYISEKLMPHFIRGLFDGDGCIWMGKPKAKPYISKRTGFQRLRIELNCKFTFTGNTEFISELQNYLVEKLSFSKTKLNFSKAKETKHICTMEYSGRGNIKKLYNYMYNNATIFGNRKFEKFKEIICADTKKLVFETRLIAGNPEMAISSQASNLLEEGSSTIPEMEVLSSEGKCLAPNTNIVKDEDIVNSNVK